MHCPNCGCPGCEAEQFCDGCGQTICMLCWFEHEKDWPDHTEHVEVMRDRRMTDEEIRFDLDWRLATGIPTPDYNAEEEEEDV